MIKLNLGSGSPRGQYNTGWINFDLCHHDRLQVRGDITTLPFRDNCVDLIHSVHVLEHLTRDKHLLVLKECLRVLQPGAAFFLEVPDFQKVVYKLADAFTNNDKESIHKWVTSVFGKTERRGMSHHYGFTYDKLIELSQAAGFSKIRRLNTEAEMISKHYWLEPIILVELIK